MKQSMLSILCHIIHGEKLLKMNKKPEAESSGTSTTTATAAETQDVNEEHLRQLMDMGFTREHARTALLNTASIEQATEYALTRAPAPTQASQVEFVLLLHKSSWIVSNTFSLV
jgi:E3 ubiquitin-protein ligase HUWE1